MGSSIPTVPTFSDDTTGGASGGCTHAVYPITDRVSDFSSSEGFSLENRLTNNKLLLPVFVGEEGSTAKVELEKIVNAAECPFITTWNWVKNLLGFK